MDLKPWRKGKIRKLLLSITSNHIDLTPCERFLFFRIISKFAFSQNKKEHERAKIRSAFGPARQLILYVITLISVGAREKIINSGIMNCRGVNARTAKAIKFFICCSEKS